MLNRHDGTEIGLTYGFRWNLGRWSFSPFVSYVWQDANLVNYYYGVDDDEASPEVPAYKTSDGYFLRGGHGG